MPSNLNLRENQHFGKTVWSLCVAENSLFYGASFVKQPYYNEYAPGRRSILFIDEEYTGDVHNIGRYVDGEWFEALQLRDVTWQQFCAGSNILTTTAGVAFGLLPMISTAELQRLVEFSV